MSAELRTSPCISLTSLLRALRSPPKDWQSGEETDIKPRRQEVDFTSLRQPNVRLRLRFTKLLTTCFLDIILHGRQGNFVTRLLSGWNSKQINCVEVSSLMLLLFCFFYKPSWGFLFCFVLFLFFLWFLFFVLFVCFLFFFLFFFFLFFFFLSFFLSFFLLFLLLLPPPPLLLLLLLLLRRRRTYSSSSSYLFEFFFKSDQ